MRVCLLPYKPPTAASHLNILACGACMQGKQILQNGIGRASEVEEDVKDVQAARTWLTTPDLLLQASPLLQQLNE